MLPFLVWCISGSRLRSPFFVRRWSLDDRYFPHQQAPLTQHDADLVKQLTREFVFLKSMPKLHQRGCTRHGFDGQAVPLLQEVQPQHALKTNRRPASKPPRIKRFDRLDQSLPRHDLLHFPRKRSRRVVRFFQAYSTSEKLICCFIAYPEPVVTYLFNALRRETVYPPRIKSAFP
jgi:hypothetical protein